MADLSDNAIAAYVAGLEDLEDAVEAAQADKRTFFESAREAQGRDFVAALKLAVKTARLDPDKREQADKVDAEAQRILDVMRKGLHVARGAHARENIDEFDPETGEITDTEAPKPLPDVADDFAAAVAQQAEAKTSDQEPFESNGSAGMQDRCESIPAPTLDDGGNTVEPDSGLGNGFTVEVAPAADQAGGEQSSPAPVAFIPNRKPLRPHCLHKDDLNKCGGSGRNHCFSCRKAAWLNGEEAA